MLDVQSLADALLGEVKQADTLAYYVCLSDAAGGFKKHKTQDLYQATATVQQWLSAGWPAWIQDSEGRNIHSVTHKTQDKN